MSLTKKIFSYSVVNVASAAVPFLLLPILTAYLSPADYGELSLVLFLQTMLLPLVLINFNGLVAVEYTRLNQDQFHRLVGTLLLLPILGWLVVAPAMFKFRDYVAATLHIPPFWVVASTVVVLLQAMPILVSSLYQAQQNPIAFGVFKISMALINIMLSLAFVIGLHMGWEGRVWGIAVTFGVFSLISFIIILRFNLLTLCFDKGYFVDGLKFGVLLIPHVISGTLLSMADRIFQANMLTNSDVGIYGVAFQVATGMMIIMSSVNQAWSPHLFQQLNSDQSFVNKQRIIRQTYKIAGLMLVMSVVFVLISPLIFKLLISPVYESGLPISRWIVVAMLFQGFYFLVANYIFYVKKTHLLSMMTALAAIVTMLLNSVLIPQFGLAGSAYAMCISWVLLFLLAWALAHRVFPMPWLNVFRRQNV